MDAIAEAQVFAARINLQVGYQLVKVFPDPSPTGGPLSLDEIKRVVHARPGTYNAATAHLLARGRPPSKSEAIRTGRWLSQLGFTYDKRGPVKLWHLDKRAPISAD